MPRSVDTWIGATDDTQAPPRAKPGVVENLAGRRFGRWLVLVLLPKDGPRRKWLCRCECGAERAVLASHLKSGASSCCGSHRLKGRTMREHPLYRTYCNIIQRCENPKNAAYENYGARGISMCLEWRSDFWQFVADMGPKPSPTHTIERVDNSLGYCPTNCVWAARQQQMRNTRRNRMVVYDGRTMPLVEACELSGVNYGTAKWRIRNGRSFDEAFS